MKTAAETMIEFAWNAPKNTQSQSLINRARNSYKYGKSEGSKRFMPSLVFRKVWAELNSYEAGEIYAVLY